ncbi:PAS domain-containing protein [Halopseudomonas maritima]|uniref:PAS domain-containing protein n=1 Tax=Halopseudomonas maritima TaxID=2918528 RepID=UPI001EECAC09|nr:PAS domain-containing protein [Halopseudomonas maritima]UJJ33103.1 PAS domain-containing protein [Halopseudomonas maritima]
MTTPDHASNGRIALALGMLLVTLCFLYLGTSAWQHREEEWRNLQYQTVDGDLRRLQQQEEALRQQAKIAVFGLSEDPDLRRLLRRVAYLVEHYGLDDPEVARLRAQIAKDLSGFWQLLQQAGAKELQIHLAPDSTALLRMQRPERWGDRADSKHPLLQYSQQHGERADGLALYPGGTSESAVAPVFASDASGSRVIATLQVGFPTFAQYTGPTDQALALLVRPFHLDGHQHDSPLHKIDTGRWLLADSPGTVDLEMLNQAAQVTRSIANPHLFKHGEQLWLASLLPRAAYTLNVNEAEHPAALMLWRDMTEAYTAHRHDLLHLAGNWLLAWFTAITLFTLLLIYTRRAASRQMALHAEAISNESQRRERDRRLLEIISHAQSAYIQRNEMAASLQRLLEQILGLTGYGRADFLQALPNDDGQLQLHSLASSTSDPVPAALQPTLTQVLRESHPQQRLASEAQGMPRALVLPLIFAGRQFGVLALSGGEQPLNPDLRAFLAPLQTALGQLLDALRQRRENETMQRGLERQRQALRQLNKIAADPGQSYQQRMVRLLDLGCDYLRLDLGLISHIEQDKYRVEAASSSSDAPTVGTEFELAQTYCSLTYQANDALVIDSMEHSRFSGHPCYQSFGLESYIGIVLVVDGQRFGTLNFSSANTRAQPFDEVDMDFIRLCGRWCSNLLEQAAGEQQREALLQRFRKLTQHLPGMVYQYQVDSSSGRSWFPYSSEGIGDIYDMTPDQAAQDAQPAIDLIHPDDWQQVAQDIQRSSEQLSDWRSEFRVRHPRLGEIWVAGYASPERLDNGDLMWHGFIADVSARRHIQQRLDEELARLARIIQATGVGSWEWDIGSRQMEASPRWFQMLGYQPEDLSPLTIDAWTDLLHPDDVADALEQLHTHLRGHSDYLRYLSRARHREGHWIWIQSQGQVTARDPQGRALTLSGIHADVSAEMRANEKVREARSYLSAVINASTEVAIIAADPQGQISLFNSGAERLLGYHSDEVVGKHSPLHFHLPEELAERSAQLSAQLGYPVEGLEVFLHEPRGGEPQVNAWTYQRKDGSRRQVKLTITRIADSQDHLIGFLGMATDITELIQTTRALQNSESRYRSMVSNLPGAVYRCPAVEDRRMTYMSHGIERISGYPASDFIDNHQRSYASIILPEDLPITLQHLELAEDDPSFEITYRLVHANGHLVQVREKGRGEFDSSGQLQSFDGFIWDVTEQARVEQMKSQFVSTVSHELRTPLTAINGSLKLMHGGALGEVPERMRSLLDIAVQNSDTLIGLINDLLDMDKLAAGKLAVQLTPQPLQPLLEQALQRNQTYAAQYRIEQHLGQVDDVIVNVDAQRLGQILSNYLSNAAKFSHSGGRVTLSAQAAEGWVRISVQDQGIGIPEQEQARIFEKFFQVDSSNTRQRAGSGLGLAISRELAQRMHGDVGFDSKPEQGSCFWLQLPLADELG